MLLIVCQMKDKSYQTGFSFGRLGHALGVGLGGTLGGWAQFLGSSPPEALVRGQNVKYH